MSQDQPFIWKSSLGGAESLGIFKVGNSVSQVDGESQIWHHPAGSGSVALQGESSEKVLWPLPCPDARHFIFSQYATGALQVPCWRWSSEEVGLTR